MTARSPSTGVPPLLRRLAFGKATRAEAWQLLADVTAGGGDLGRYMETVAEGYRLQGRPWVAAALLDIRGGLSTGDMAERIRPYGGQAETVLFEALGRRDASGILAGAARVLRMELRIRRAVQGAVALPVLLAAGLLGLVMFFGLELLPALSEVTDLDRLPQPQAAVTAVTMALTRHPWAIPAAALAAIAAFGALMRLWTGPGRTLADRFPPFSLMRLAAGAGFVFSAVEYGRAGQAVSTGLLERMAAAAPPYARSRIRAVAAQMVPAHSNLGDAALRAGQGFPAPELSTVLRALWTETGGIGRVAAFLERWLEGVEDRIRSRMALLNAALMAAIAVALVLLMSVALPIADMISQGAGL